MFLIYQTVNVIDQKYHKATKWNTLLSAGHFRIHKISIIDNMDGIVNHTTIYINRWPYNWVILDPKSKEDKVKVTNLKNLPKFQFDLILKHTLQETHLWK